MLVWGRYESLYRHTPCFSNPYGIRVVREREWRAAAACCPHQAPLRIFHREFTSLDTTGKLQEWRSNLSLALPPRALSSFLPLFPFTSSLGLPPTHTHTILSLSLSTLTEENSSVFLLDKRDLSSRVEMARAA